MYKRVAMEGRSVISVSGKDAASFLQGIISNDVHKVDDTHSIYACVLTPQGKFLFDFFVCKYEQSFLLDCRADTVETLMKRLQLYTLRSDVTIKNLSDDFQVFVCFGDDVATVYNLALEKGNSLHEDDALFFVDPRSEAMGLRILCKNAAVFKGEFEDQNSDFYEEMRIKNTIPEGVSDLVPEQSYPLHFGFDMLSAIDFEKGCYVGQEVTTRTKHRGKVPKILCSVVADAELPEPGSLVAAKGETIGELCSVFKNFGMALVKKELFEKYKENEEFSVNDKVISLALPVYFQE